jgi:hypothetical protein
MNINVHNYGYRHHARPVLHKPEPEVLDSNDLLRSLALIVRTPRTNSEERRMKAFDYQKRLDAAIDETGNAAAYVALKNEIVTFIGRL